MIILTINPKSIIMLSTIIKIKTITIILKINIESTVNSVTKKINSYFNSYYIISLEKTMIQIFITVDMRRMSKNTLEYLTSFLDIAKGLLLLQRIEYLQRTYLMQKIITLITAEKGNIIINKQKKNRRTAYYKR